MKFHADHPSFLAPYLRAPNEAEEAFLAAGREVEGANARAEEARKALEDLTIFRQAIARLIEQEGFAQLPRLRNRWLRPIGHYRYLDQGVWRGLFLVAADGSVVVAVIFSRAPHDYLGRLEELTRRHSAKLVSKGRRKAQASGKPGP